jgi:ankyrin repeat protein
MLFDNEDLVYEICTLTDEESVARLGGTCTSLARSCENVTIVLFMQIFGVNIREPSAVLPRDTLELRRLIKRSRSLQNLDELGEVFNYACAAGYSSYVNDCLRRCGPIERKFLINKLSSNGCPPLTLAAAGDSYPIVEALINAGAIINSKDYRGRSALWYACNIGNADIVNLLMNSGAIIDSNPSILTACLSSDPPDIRRFPYFLSCLRFIAKRMLESADECLRMLGPPDVSIVSDISSRITALLDPICSALKSTSTHSSRLLIELLQMLEGPAETLFNFYRSRITSFPQDPPLYVAASLDKCFFFDQLVRCGVSTVNDVSQKTGKSALFIAAEKGHINSVRALLNLKASIGTLSATGRNCLHAAVEKDHTDIVELLCEHAVTDDILHPNSSQISPFTLAENRGRIGMITAMLECYKRTVSDSTINAFLNSKVLKYLMKKKYPKRRKSRAT